MVLKSGRNILPIFLVFCVSDLVLGNEFKFEYYTKPDSIKLKFDYDCYQIVSIKYGRIRQYQSIQKYETFSHGFIRIKNLVPYTLYDFFARVKNKYTNITFDHHENILMISTGLVLKTEPYEDTIEVSMNHEYEACFHSFVVMINNSIVILDPHANLSGSWVIKNLSPSKNYHLEIYIKIESEFYKIHDKTVTTKSIQFREIESINYDNVTTTLRWPNFLKTCPMKYLIIITLDNNQTGIEPIIHKSVRNEYKLDFLDGCSTYNITVISENDRDLSMNISIEQGFKDPGPITNLKAELVNTTLLIDWSPPTKNPACIDHYNVKIDKIQFDTKALEYTLLDYNPSKIYSITVCQVALVVGTCMKYKFGIQNVSKIDVNSNSFNNVTTITWNVSDYEKQHIKYYKARLFDESKELMWQKNDSAMIRFPDLVPCKTYRLEIETFPNKKWPSKIISIFELTTKPKLPDTPLPPELISNTSNSLTMQTKYVNLNDKCKIEMFKIVCKDHVHTSRYAYDEEGLVTINNLKSNTGYHCKALAKNGLGWSSASASSNFYSDPLPGNFIQMYVNSLSSNFIQVSWITRVKNGSWFLKANKAGSIPKRCDPLMYNFSTHIFADPSYRFETLDPNTNYSIHLYGASKENTDYVAQIFVTTDPDVPFQVTHLNISDLTGRSVTIIWKLPCKINGRIKSFVGQVVEIDPDSLIKTVYDWTIPYYSTLEAIEIFNYTENRIKPEHNYSISVAIKLVNFAHPLNKSKIQFISEGEPAKPDRSSDLVIIIPIVCTSVIICLILIGLAYWRCFSGNPNPESVYMEILPFFNPRKRPSNALIRSQFKLICNMDLTNLTKAIPKNQVPKNLIPHSVPYDFNRIILKPNQYCLTDYINASYIDGYNKKSKYIATQDPTQDTVYNFWHMVIQEKCDQIVMLTGLAKNGSLQYFHYYPKLNEKLKFGDLIIKNVDETKYCNCIKRLLYILDGQKKRHVYHYQYSAWSNGDSPENMLEIFEFIDMSGIRSKTTLSPIIVHSSAGVGRTGTFIALDILFQELLLSDITSISQTVKELRLQRSGMVETLAQYEFLYEAIESYYLTRIYKIKGYL